MQYTIRSEQLKLADEIKITFRRCTYFRMTGRQISNAMKLALDNLIASGEVGLAKVNIGGDYSVSPFAAGILYQFGSLIEKRTSEEGINFYDDFPDVGTPKKLNTRA